MKSRRVKTLSILGNRILLVCGSRYGELMGLYAKCKNIPAHSAPVPSVPNRPVRLSSGEDGTDYGS